MQHISEILARLDIPVDPVHPDAPVPDWRRAAEAAHARARAATNEPASLPQLERICQLLSSHVVSERERERALDFLARGCTRSRARAMLDYLLPSVRDRKAAEALRHNAQGHAGPPDPTANAGRLG